MTLADTTSRLEQILNGHTQQPQQQPQQQPRQQQQQQDSRPESPSGVYVLNFRDECTRTLRVVKHVVLNLP